MSNNSVRVSVGDLLNIEGFNPEKVDLSEIAELSNKIPASGVVDEAIADELAALFLHGADRVSDLLAQATRWSAYKMAEKSSSKSEAMLIRAEEKGYTKTQGAREAYAVMDEQYLDANSKDAVATAWKRWLENKYELFLKWHHLCKSIAERHHQGFGSSANDRSSGHDDDEFNLPPSLR